MAGGASLAALRWMEDAVVHPVMMQHHCWVPGVLPEGLRQLAPAQPYVQLKCCCHDGAHRADAKSGDACLASCKGTLRMQGCMDLCWSVGARKGSLCHASFQDAAMLELA